MANATSIYARKRGRAEKRMKKRLGTDSLNAKQTARLDKRSYARTENKLARQSGKEAPNRKITKRYRQENQLGKWRNKKPATASPGGQGQSNGRGGSGRQSGGQGPMQAKASHPSVSAPQAPVAQPTPSPSPERKTPFAGVAGALGGDGFSNGFTPAPSPYTEHYGQPVAPPGAPQDSKFARQVPPQPIAQQQLGTKPGIGGAPQMGLGGYPGLFG